MQVIKNHGSVPTSSSATSIPAAPTTKSFRSNVTAIWEKDAVGIEKWILSSTSTLSPAGLLPGSTKDHKSVHISLWQNLRKALDSLKMVPLPPTKTDDEEEGEDEPSAKRQKTGRNNSRMKPKKKRPPPIRYARHDPFNLWLHVPLPKNEDGDEDSGSVLGEDEDVIPPTIGGRLSQLGVAGFVNAFALVTGGHVRNKNVTEPKDEAARSQVLLQLNTKVAPISLTALHIHRLAVTWHRVIQAKVRQDILVTTPLRIQDMLASDLSAQEFASIRKRIYDTVILNKGLHVNDGDTLDETLATAKSPSGAVLEAEKFKKCPTCHNNDQSNFVLDRKNGDVICSNCGTVVSESLMHEGSQFRKFEGEVDRNHHGDAANPLYSNAHNMSTTLSGVTQVSGAGIGGWGSQKGGGRNLETILRNAHDYIELNVSQLGKTDRRTRIGYKDRQKKEAFVQMGHVGDALSLHEAVVQRAKELFAGFRDDRELVQQFKGVIAACLCEAFDQLSTQGLNILKQDDIKTEEVQSGDGKAGSITTEPGTVGYSARAARRNELHHAKLAGKGGLLLDFSDVSTVNKAKLAPKKEATSPTAPQSALEETPAATWDLEHCRSWLLEASRRIAQQWVDERTKGTAASKHIPKGTLEDLEGSLVEHSFTLCEQLEAELLARESRATGNAKGRRVATPRINDMSKLGIKWQHSHERGSGGAAGLGGSGTAKTAKGADKTAGQMLILKTAKKLGAMLKDPIAGDAIHKELRVVVGKQEARKLKERREEASRQRMMQMKRKPWLQARVNG